MSIFSSSCSTASFTLCSAKFSDVVNRVTRNEYSIIDINSHFFIYSCAFLNEINKFKSLKWNEKNKNLINQFTCTCRRLLFHSFSFLYGLRLIFINVCMYVRVFVYDAYSKYYLCKIYVISMYTMRDPSLMNW